jgi:hypothetical protein
MQVSDAGRLMRSTLQAAKILIELRGMHPLLGGSSELDIDKWLPRRAALEQLDVELFEEVANTFVAELLDHAHKQVVLGRVAASRQQRERKLAKKKPGARMTAAARRRAHAELEQAEADEAAQEEETLAATQDAVVRMQGNVYSIKRLVSDFQEFVPHLYPLLFTGRPPPDRPHARLDYRLAAIVHTGNTVKAFNATLKSVLERIDRVRHERATQFGYTSASAKSMPCRIMLVLWGAAFHPKSGRSYNIVRNGIAVLNAKQREADSNITFEMFSVVELQYDAAAHQDVGRTSVVAAPLRELRTVKEHQFAYMRDTDVQARLHDYSVGQIIRADRTDFDLAGRSYDYRVVVPHDHVLEKPSDADVAE